MKRVRVLCAVGTRPEAIKMAPVVQALRSEPWAEVRLLATAQHRDMLDQTLRLFALHPDVDLDIMRPDQSLVELTARLVESLDRALAAESPDVVLAQGDTTTVFAAGLVCAYRRTAFGHVEAGLRTGNYDNPFPEELNRVLVGRLARWHFAPTAGAEANLKREGVPADSIFVTGNTVIDALLQVAGRQEPLHVRQDPSRRLLLVTAHRRESFGAPMQGMCDAIRSLVDRNADVEVLFPVHPNPNVREVVERALGTHPRVTLTPPLDYGPFVAAMHHAYLVLTDSGGVQEEAPALGRPVLVLRDDTERPEAVAAGVVRVVGTDPARIVDEAQRLLDDAAQYRAMARGVSPYGDGRAAWRIARILAREAAHMQPAPSRSISDRFDGGSDVLAPLAILPERCER